MQFRKNFITISCFLMLVLGYQCVHAQQDIAQEVYAIFEKSCLGCHGESGAYKDSLLIDRTALVDTQIVIPGDPENSEFYKRLLGPTEKGPQMPLNLPPLSQEAIETIARWITEGAPDWNVQRNINFITTNTILDTIQTHLQSLDAFDRPSARYFTLTHLYNAGESPETLSEYRIALSKLINSLSWKFEITNPTPIDTAQTIFYIDLRRYEWNKETDVWGLIEQAYPYNIAFDPETQAGLIEKLTQLQTETGSAIPYINADWFLATASLPPLYHDILDLPQTDRDLEKQLEVNVESNIRNAPGIDVWRAGFNDSGVSSNNRVVERHIFRDGAYWKSYDFAGSTGSQHIFTHPIDFTHDGGEIIFNLPNGLQAYFLVDANGTRLDDAPIDIVSNPAASDPTVRNGLSCIGCHTQGMKKFKDTVRAAIEADPNPPYNKAQALRLYPEQSVLDDLLQEDTQRFQQALEKIGGPFEDDESRQRFFKRHENEPIQRFHEVFQGPLDASHAAAAVGLETVEFLTQIGEKQSLKNLGLQTLIGENGTVKRDAWTSNFHDVIDALNTPDSILPPVVERPERIPGAGVYIPDANLRAAIARMLGKSIDEPITIKEMESFRHLNIGSELTSSKKIKDLTGLEYAINLEVLWFSNNEVSDLSPLAGLTKMIQMSMEHNPITSFSALTNMEELQSIQISHNNIINDITPLAGKTKLRSVLIWGCPITDISPLADLPSIDYIDLCGNQISEIPSFENAPKLKKLYIYNNEVSDVSVLQNHTNLERLNLRDNNITDISPLAALTNLKWLDLTNNPISDFSPLAELAQTTNIIAGHVNIPDRNLRAAIAKALGKDDTGVISITFEEMATLTYLNVSNYGKQQRINIKNLEGLEFAIQLNHLNIGINTISDLSPLARLENLTFLDVADNLISDISQLKGLTNLRGLILTGNLISDLSPLEALTNLEALRVNSNPISNFIPITNLTTLKEIWISHSTLSDLTPFEGLINLEGIHVWDAPIEDLSPLTGLTKLRWLNFGRTQVSDLAPLANLTNLRKLTFYDCDIQDLSDLEGLTELVHIKMPHNTISDLSPLESAIRLTYLEVGNNEISDISALEKLTNLETLWIDNNNISDLSPLSELTNLQELNIRNNPITDFSPLAGLFENTKILFDFTIPDVNLRSAIVEALGKEDMTAPITLADMATLTTLRASNKDIKDLTGLEFAINLEEMWISKNPVSNLSPLAGLTNFIGLHAWETPISDLSPLAGLTKLRWLDFGHTPTDANGDLIGNLDLSPLAGLTSLKKLTFYACGIKDISPLANLTGLTLLAVGGNPISDASPVAELINLEHLDFHHDSISDLAQLAGLTKLKYLNLHDNRLISDLSPLIGLTGLIELRLSKNIISDISPLARLIDLEELTLDENQISDISSLTGLINLKVLTLRENLIIDISSLERFSEHTYIALVGNPGVPKGGPKIEGPWLWMLIPGNHLDSVTDLLAEASNGLVTEHQIAAKGATEGKSVGNIQWTAHKIPSTGKQNLLEVLRDLGQSDYSHYDEIHNNVLYGSVILDSPREQKTWMFVGTDGHHKIWLNGELIHNDLGFPRSYYRDYDLFFPITLRQGANILLVAIDGGYWFNGFFGFEEGTEYVLIPPGVGFTFSTTETDVITGDTFTLNLNAENITDLAGYQADITFHPAVLEAIEVTEGDFLKVEGEGTFFQGGTIDNAAGKITNLFAARISESGASGTGRLLSVTFKAKAGGETQVTLENFEFISITDDIIPTIPPNITITVGGYPAWDVNQDGRVNIRDLVLVAKDLGSGMPANLRSDVNRDGVVDIRDVILVAQHIGESTDSAASPILATDSKELTSAMVQTWLEQAQIANDGSIVFRQGIENLQKLLASLIPEKTALLANYPNPFNPETWIPYNLAKSAEVTLAIYAANGAVVRTLALGHQTAGIYQSRNRAAYWDGKNALGESVASGVYFYTLTAGGFSATRKMLILK